MRTFIGIDFCSELKYDIYNLQQKAKSFAFKGRWKYIDNFHLTLKFLGEINQCKKNLIDDALISICRKTAPFRLAINRVGKFNGKADIRVLWLGLSGDLKTLNQLQADINNALEPLGFEKDKRIYKPHITVGQDIMLKCSFEELNSELTFNSDPFIVDRLYLFKSEQLDNKRIYTKISEYKFHI